MRSYRLFSRLGLGLLVGAVLSLTGAAQQILEVDSSSLTTYLAGATSVNKVLPLVSQRGVNIDGSIRSSPGFPMAIAGNPSENAWVGQQSQGPLRIDIGAYAPFDVDIALPTTGPVWIVARTFNPLQSTASEGPMGVNWSNTSMPEVVLYEGASDSDDVLYLVYGADRFVEYRRTSDANSLEFKGKNGAAGCFQYASNSSAADTYTLTDQVGNVFVFFGFDGASGVAAGQFWKMTDPAGNTAYVGDATTSSTAITNGYDSTCGGIKLAYDASDHRFTYTYSTL